MLTKEEENFIDKYVSDDAFDTKKLKKYLGVHDTVGNEVFAYCMKPVDENHGRNRSYNALLDDDGYAFFPVSKEKFIRRIPFYFYIPGEKAENRGGLVDVFCSKINEGDDSVFNPEFVENVYRELEYVFYEKSLPRERFFCYMIDQYGVVTAPFMEWVDYVHICDELGWDDYFPESFISKYNMALEAAGRKPIIYEVEEPALSGEVLIRNGKKVWFYGKFPQDENGEIVLRWTNIRVENAANIECVAEKSKSGKLVVELLPTTIIQWMDRRNDWIPDSWTLLYAGPLTMNFDYTVLKWKRKKLGFTQQEVADAIGATVRTYQKWESGVTTPDGNYLLRLMNWLDLPDPHYVISYPPIAGDYF